MQYTSNWRPLVRPSDGAQFFVCLSSSVTNGATLPRSGIALFLYQARKEQRVVLRYCLFVLLFRGDPVGLEIV